MSVRSMARSPFRSVLLVAALAACAGETAAPSPVQLARGGAKPLATLEWNGIARDMIAKHKPNQQAAQRAMAYLTLAQFTAASEARDLPPAPITTQGAIAAASATVLAYAFPADSAVFHAGVEARAVALAPGRDRAFRQGMALGNAIGARAVSLAKADRFSAPWTGTVPTGPGIWFSSTTPPTPPALPMLGQMEPFLMATGSQFRSAPPPAFGSPAFAEALGEVRQIALTRTAAQDSIAKFWAMGTGTLIAGFWNETAVDIIARERLNERDAARALALMNVASMDALIACADGKFAYWLIRPSQADPTFPLAIGLPNFPSYPSNHACFSGAAAYVLGALFPDDRQRLEAMAYEAGMSRTYGGIHYRFDSDAGLEIARKVTELTLAAGDDVAGLLQ